MSVLPVLVVAAVCLAYGASVWRLLHPPRRVYRPEPIPYVTYADLHPRPNDDASSAAIVIGSGLVGTGGHLATLLQQTLSARANDLAQEQNTRQYDLMRNMAVKNLEAALGQTRRRRS
jgi:hypothetical protein